MIRLTWLSIIAVVFLSTTVAAAAPTSSASKAKEEVPSASVVDGNLIVRRPIAGESRVTLKYTIGTAAPLIIEGTKDDENWSFLLGIVPEKETILRLEFGIYRTVDDAHQQIVGFARGLREDVTKALQEADLERLPNGDRLPTDQWLERAADLAAEKIAKRLEKKPLQSMVANGRPATEVVLNKLGFQKDTKGQWRFDTRSHELLHALAKGDPAIENAAFLAKGTSTHVCLSGQGDVKADPLARRKALHACFGAYLTELNGIQANKAPPKEWKEFADTARAIPHGTVDETWNSLVDLSVTLGSSSFRKAAAAKALSNVQYLLLSSGEQSSAEKLIEVEGAMSYVIALEAHEHYVKQRPKTAQAWSERLLDDQLLQDLKVEVWGGTSKELYEVEPGKPRFFFSTGLVATVLRDDVKLGLPIMTSICLSPAGCETKGFGSGGSPWNYVTFDLGIKAFFIGEQDARESSPSFLMGAGFTPFYATHVGIGVDVFENPQTDRANAAFYMALTLDLVDGKDILGKLGIGTPEVKPIGGKQ